MMMIMKMMMMMITKRRRRTISSSQDGFDDANVRHLMRERERIELDLIRARGTIDRWRMWAWRPVDLAAAAVSSVRMLERLAAIRSPDIAAEPVLPEIEKIAAEVRATLDALLRESETR